MNIPLLTTIFLSSEPLVFKQDVFKLIGKTREQNKCLLFFMPLGVCIDTANNIFHRFLPLLQHILPDSKRATKMIVLTS